MSNPEKSDPGAESATIKHVQFVCEYLQRNKTVNRDDFVRACREKEHPAGAFAKLTTEDQEKYEKNLYSEWTRIRDSVFTVLKQAKIVVTMDSERRTLYTPNGLSAKAEEISASDGFLISEDEEDKRAIGGLVAEFLYSKCNSNESVFLGSGTTMWHVGHAMCELSAKKGKPYRQKLFLTINLPLAAHWCEASIPPSDKISIPRGVLETKPRRFETLQEDTEEQRRWTPALVIVGADGVYYNDSNGRIWLYGTSESVASNTNLFVKSAKTIVLYCLASNKTKGRNDGPKLAVPDSKRVVKVVVTDGKKLSTAIKTALTQNQEYYIVQNMNDFEAVIKANDNFNRLEEPDKPK